MTTLEPRSTTESHPLAHIGTLLASAEHLCHVVAGRDLGGTPLYIVPQSSLPAGRFAGDRHRAFTTPSLDLYLRDHIPGYRGRGPCMVINDLAMAEDCEPDDLAYVVPASVLHELAHILDRPALFADRTGVDPNRLVFESLVVAHSTNHPPSDDASAYLGHEAGFIRIVLHLCQRASLAGMDVAPAAIHAGYRYGLSHVADYQDALGDEPVRCLGRLFRDIAATAAPPGFSRLWQEDLVSYHHRFPHLKGASV